MELSEVQIDYDEQGWFALNVDRLVILLLPILWRKPKMVAFLQALASPIKLIHYDWKVMRVNNLYRIRHNWMKCYLQAALNDEFDPEKRRITIDEPEIFANKYIYTFGESKPKYLGKMYLRTHQENSGNGIDFTVNMNGAFANTYDIRALVDYYKMDGPKYKIIGMLTFETIENE
ncbi:MAG TPA: hypothetical protein VL022_04900 [Moheibacter sp.]|nr:hypothetical protein [Moheibacter sp.]